jgi:hypothetical protein
MTLAGMTAPVSFESFPGGGLAVAFGAGGDIGSALCKQASKFDQTLAKPALEMELSLMLIACSGSEPCQARVCSSFNAG